MTILTRNHFVSSVVHFLVSTQTHRNMDTHKHTNTQARKRSEAAGEEQEWEELAVQKNNKNTSQRMWGTNIKVIANARQTARL